MTGSPGRRYAGQTSEERATERHSAFLEAGLELFGTRPYEQVTVAHLTAESGQNRRAFYELYADREQLLLAVHDKLAVEQLEHTVQAVGDLPPASWEAAEQMVRANLGWYRDDPRRARVQFVAVVGVSPAMEDRRRRAVRELAETFGAWAGDRAGPDAAARRRAMLVYFGGSSELLMDWLWAGDDDLEAIIDELVTTTRARFFPDRP